MQAPSLLQTGCTRSLDATINNVRAAYAAERDDFHTYFSTETVRDIQRILRSGARPDERGDGCRGVVLRLLDAQRRSPHTLWKLLLVQAFEPTLVKRRRARSCD